LNKEHQKQQEEFDNLHQQLTSQLKEKDEEQNERYSQLNNLLSEKSELENELENVRRQMQSTLNENTKDHQLQLEQKIKEFEVC
jgi:hypothetical protein